MVSEVKYTKIFEESAEGLRITLEIEDGAEDDVGRAFNLNTALWVLGSQLQQQAKKESEDGS